MMISIDDMFDNNIFPVEDKKKMSEFRRKIENEAKPEKCILCGKKTTSFCNSHSVPKMILKNIAENGKVYSSNAMVGAPFIDIEKGINNSGTFHFICKECDSKRFQRYENIDSLKVKPDKYILAEIALKNTLLQLSKRQYEIKQHEVLQALSNNIVNPEILSKIQALDVRDYEDELQYHLNILEQNGKGGYNVAFWKLLPYKVPIAVQTGLSLQEDLEGFQVNAIYNMESEYSVETLHLCVFPLQNQTAVLLFTAKNSKKYNKWLKQVNRRKDVEMLRYINWLIFKYTENYYMSPSIVPVINNDSNLKKLSRESGGYDNLGFLSFLDTKKPKKRIQPSDIPNFLDGKMMDKV